MPLVTCPECGHRVSDAADACPGCGYPIAARMAWERTRAGQPMPPSPPQPPPAPMPYHVPVPRSTTRKKQQGGCGCVGTVVTIIVILWIMGTCVSVLQNL